MKAIGFFVVVFAIIFIFGGLLHVHFNVTIPADVAYNRAFGSNVDMLVHGSTSLVGDEGSMDFYLMQLWNTMNETWDDQSKFRTTYANEPSLYLGTLGCEVPHNSLAATNQYFNSLNATLYKKQAVIDAAVANGTYIGTSDPIQEAINQTRKEINSYGGIDWVIHDLYMRTYQPAAYWSSVTVGWIILVGIIVAVLGVIIYKVRND